jgi:acyl-CoA thioester hydrolase
VSDRPQREKRSAYRTFCAITTRWIDNDVYGHVNNAVYYSYFDTAVNSYLIKTGFLDYGAGEVIGVVAETQCSYFAPIAFPDQVTAGLRVERIGRSSVRYAIGLFRNADEMAAAQGYFTHVYIDRVSSRPVALPQALRHALAPLEI